MLTALIAVTFVAGVFAGIIILAMILVYLVNNEKDTDAERKLKKASDTYFEKHDGVWSNPILRD